MIFGIKTRRELKNEIKSLMQFRDFLNTLLKSKSETITFNEDVINKIIFNNEYNEPFKDYAVLVVENVSDDNIENNATLYCDEDNKYLYLSKKLINGYKFLSINYYQNKLRFILNNDGVGIEIDSNNRVKHKETIMFLKEYFGFKNKKIEIFFEKI